MTMDIILESIVTTTGYNDHKPSIATIIITFDCKSSKDSTRSIFVKRDVVDSLWAFLEMLMRRLAGTRRRKV